MTSLSPDALMVSLVQAATIVPVFLFALPAGAIADIVDRRTLILGTQSWMLAAAVLLTMLTWAHATTAWTLLALTFAIGAGSAMNNPAWGSVMAESVPRRDLVQAIALNGVGFNIARAVGPALAGFLLLAGGPALTFGLNAASYLAVIGVLLTWRRRRHADGLPREHFLSAIKAGTRFVRHTPPMRAAIWRATVYFAPGAAPWAMLPLVVREQLQEGAGIYGVLLGLMGVGGVTAGLILPQLRMRFSRSNLVLFASLLSYGGMAVLGVSRHWMVAGLGMLMFGLGWVTTASITQGAAQMAAPSWVRARALAIYQLSFNFALAMGTFFWGWLGTQVGLTTSMLSASVVGSVLAVAARGISIDAADISFSSDAAVMPSVEAVAPELAPTLAAARGRVLESQHYRIAPGSKDEFLRAMVDVRGARARGGAVQWHLGEDIHAPEHWVELWWVETWTDHLREAGRLSESDRAALARAMAFHVKGDLPATRRFLSINPQRPPVV